MKYSLSWLKDYLKTDKSVDELGETMVSLGSEVEEISSFPKIDDKIIAVKIVKIEPHPNADRLRLPTVFDGEKKIRIVCGAPNIEEGQIVPLAQIGAKIGDIEITEAEIRGVKSTGMLCSERELGLSDEHTGIKILPDDTRLGVKVKDILSKDHVFELEITPNRGDLLSHFGLARDLSAKFGNVLTKPELNFETLGNPSDLKVTIESDKCSLYMAREIKGVKIAPSPEWLQERLLSVGAKPINNVVDVTNYIMLDLGHPLHAFDKSKLKGDITVKEIENEIDVVTLDGERRALLPEMLGIWDSESPVAVAGVMGLGNSEVDDQTTDIVIEAAVFDRKSIRKTAKLLNLKTEASARFERGVDDATTEYALNKAVKIIQKIAGGEVSGNLISAGEVKEKSKVELPNERINLYADLTLSDEEIEKILARLGFAAQGGEVFVPTWRHDISIWQDLAEEVYRINGLEKIKPIALPELSKPEPSDYYKKEKIKDYLSEIGLDEAISYTFLSDTDVTAAKLDPSNLLEVANPVQDENRYLRNSLIPGLLKAVAKNPSFDDVEIFEVGSVFSKTEAVSGRNGNLADNDKNEWFSLAIVTSGKSARKAEKIVKSLSEKFGFDENIFNTYQIDQEELTRFKIKKPFVTVAEVKVSDLLKLSNFDDLSLRLKKERVSYRPISRFPSAKRDLAIVVDRSVSFQDIKDLILAGSSNVILVELFDEFESDKFGAGKKSVAFHIWLEDENRTLADKEADEIIYKILHDLKEKFGAELRS